MDVAFFILLVFVLTGLIHGLIFYFVYSNSAHIESNGQPIKDPEPSLTVLICARNEAHNLHLHLSKICQQEYDALQVVVVNHKSSDETNDVLEELTEKHSNLQVVNCAEDNKFLPGKRSAIISGLKSAKGSFILLTDADCYPASNQWARIMMSRLIADQSDVVLGVGRYQKRKGLLNAFIQFETFHTAMLYLTTAIKSWAYMGVGRNMLVKKEILEKCLIASAIPGVLSGDDDLLIANLSFTHDISVEAKSAAHTISMPKDDWSSYFAQKKRHVSTANYYRDFHRWMLQVFHGCQAIFLISFLLLLFSKYFLWGVGIYMVRCLFIGLRMRRFSLYIDKKHSLKTWPAFEYLLVFIPFLSWINNSLSATNEWN